MNESIIISESVKAYFSVHTSLAVLGRQMCKLKVFEPIVQEVKIAQKIVRYSPSEKLLDAWLAILAGAGCGYDRATVWQKSQVGQQGLFCQAAQPPWKSSRLCAWQLV